MTVTKPLEKGVSPPETGPSGWCARSPVLVYLGLALGFSTAGLLLARLGPDALADTRVPITFAKYGPSLAGLAVAWGLEGRSGTGRLLGGLDPRAVRMRWLVLALLLPTLVYGVALVGALGGPPAVPETGWIGLTTAFAGLFAVRFLAGGGLGEELGWRGLMLPLMAERHGALHAAVLVGVAHGLWHAPASGLASASALVLLTLPWSILLAWCYYASGGSLLVCAIAHAAGNAWVPLVGSYYAEAGTPWLVLVVVLSWIASVPAAGWLLHRAPGRQGDP